MMAVNRRRQGKLEITRPQTVACEDVQDIQFWLGDQMEMYIRERHGHPHCHVTKMLQLLEAFIE